ncbi:hypothetical protein BDEG_23593 [Batrachochytrium dendrobatidis JEL423]|uniref:Uncharacterized protein n=1 Tax=Batrachochytrium dendrobatidis (strain JEL423) TaxID=403673 RepID=A0A177WKB0_BATDL|nr:hypothetical protein BDEG_23593 [Batrachochytrium dendrobatidis JEL423]
MLATTESVIVEQDRVLDTDILRDVTALIAQLASAINTRKHLSKGSILSAIPYEDLLFWVVHQNILHPLRDVLDVPVFVIVSAKTFDSVVPDQLEMHWKDVIHVGVSSKTITASNPEAFLFHCFAPKKFKAYIKISQATAVSINSIIPEITVVPSKALCSATYEILNKPIFSNHDNHASSTIDLHVDWDSSDLKLLSAPVNANGFSLLQTLTTWNRIRQEDPQWTSCVVDSNTDKTQNKPNLPLSNLVDEFLSETKTNLEVLQDAKQNKFEFEETGSDSTESSGGFNPLKRRQVFDFAEQVWVFCQQGTLRADITDALTAIIEELETGRLLPRVAKDNLSSFANIIRSCLKLSVQHQAADAKDQRESITATFDFWLEQPLECLVDIGLWKLKRDYEFQLLDGNNASRHQLEFFMDSSLSFDHQILRLWCLHRTLELICLIKCNILVMSSEVLRSITQTTLRYYRNLVEQHETNVTFNDEKVDISLNIDVPFTMQVYLPRFSTSTQKTIASLTSSFEISRWKATIKDATQHDACMDYQVILDSTNLLFTPYQTDSTALTNMTSLGVDECMMDTARQDIWGYQKNGTWRSIVVRHPSSK